jgi:hypothetical protein
VVDVVATEDEVEVSGFVELDSELLVAVELGLEVD